MSEDILITFVIRVEQDEYEDFNREYIDNNSKAITEAVQEFKDNFSTEKQLSLGYFLENQNEITWIQIGQK